MKRRKSKRGSKAARPPEIPHDAEKAVEPSIVLAEADHQTPPPGESVAAVETEKAVEPPVVPYDADRRTPPPYESVAAFETEKPVEPPVVLAGTDRRTHPRYEFAAAVEVIAAESGARMETRVRDLSQQGCYVDTNKPLPLGTVTDMRIRKETQLFEAEARVVYSRAGKAMGLVFTAIEPEQLRTLETWLVESRETSWLAANQRKSQPELKTIPVRVSGKTGSGMTFS